MNFREKFADLFIGHKVSTYLRLTDDEIEENFRQIAPHLTFLDYPLLERQDVDMRLEIESLKRRNQMLEGDKEKEKQRILAFAREDMLNTAKQMAVFEEQIEQLKIQMARLTSQS